MNYEHLSWFVVQGEPKYPTVKCIVLSLFSIIPWKQLHTPASHRPGLVFSMVQLFLSSCPLPLGNLVYLLSTNLFSVHVFDITGYCGCWQWCPLWMSIGANGFYHGITYKVILFYFKDWWFGKKIEKKSLDTFRYRSESKIKSFSSA